MTGQFVAYVITNNVTGSKYIGVTVGSAEKRWRTHIRDSRKQGRPGRRLLLAAIREFGEQSFSIEHIASAIDRPSLWDLECLLIQKYKSQAPNGYNMTNGGYGASCPRPAEVRARISAAMKGVPKSAEHAKNAGAGNRGKPRGPRGPMPDEIKAKIGAANRGRVRSPDVVDAMRLRRIDTKQSPETVAKRVAKIKGRKMSAAQKEAIARTLTGVRHTPERRAALSAAWVLRRERMAQASA